MAGQKGIEMVIKQGDGGSPETFTTILAASSTSLTLNGSSIDVTASDSVDGNGKLFRELIAGGITSMDFNCSFRVKEDAGEAALMTLFMALNTVQNWQVVVPGLGTFAGAFNLASLTFDGPLEADVTGEASFESAGVFTFTAA